MPQNDPEIVEKSINDLFDTVYPLLNKMLESKPFICTQSELSVVDIVYYNEVLTAINICGKQAALNNFKFISAWMAKIKDDYKEISEIDAKFIDVL